jgi:hypothetical protein
MCSPSWTAEAWLGSCGIPTPDGLAVPIIGNLVIEIVIPSLIKTGSHNIALIDRPVNSSNIVPLSIFEEVFWLYKTNKLRPVVTIILLAYLKF